MFSTFSQASSLKKRSFRTAVKDSIFSLDPANAKNTAELWVLSNLVEPLLSLDFKKGHVRPQAAESYEVSKDGLVITFILRKDLFWSNGQKITSSDFVYSLRRLIRPETESWFSDRLRLIRGADEMADGAIMDPALLGIQEKDERSFVVVLQKPSIFSLHLFAEPGTAPVPKEAIQRHGSNWTNPKNWVGNGPFILTKHTERELILHKNPHHRLNSKIKLDEVRVAKIQNSREGVERYLAGELDQFGHRDFVIPSVRMQDFSGKKDLVFQSDLRTYFLRLNPSRPPFSREKIRQAFALATDRDLLKESIARGGEQKAYSLVPDGTLSYDAPRGYLYNASGARKILRDLGYCVKKQTRSCKQFPLVELIYPGTEKKKKMALAIQAIFQRNLGVDRVSIQAKPREDFLRRIAQGKYKMALDDLAVLPEKPFAFLTSFQNGTNMAGGFSHFKFDSLLDSAERSLSWSKAKQKLRHAESILLREGGIIPLLHGSSPFLVSPRVKGFVPNLLDLHPFAEISLSR